MAEHSMPRDAREGETLLVSWTTERCAACGAAVARTGSGSFDLHTSRYDYGTRQRYAVPHEVHCWKGKAVTG